MQNAKDTPTNDLCAMSQHRTGYGVSSKLHAIKWAALKRPEVMFTY